jgi:hypothetical protein
MALVDSITQHLKVNRNRIRQRIELTFYSVNDVLIRRVAMHTLVPAVLAVGEREGTSVAIRANGFDDHLNRLPQ